MPDAMPPHVPQISGLSEIVQDFDAYILDLWGVLHNGVEAFDHAVATLEELKALDKRCVILSNAPRRAEEVSGTAARLGVREDLREHVVSSGEVTWQALKTRPDDFYRSLGRRCFHIGPDRDKGMREGLDLDFVEDLGEADFLLNTGAHMPEDTAETYGHELRAGVARDLPMICANPDLEVIRGNRREICAGMLAKLYEELGGTVRYHGKPHPEVYEVCLAWLKDVPKARIITVGDSLKTDVRGARRAGLASLFITGGIHGEALGQRDGEAVAAGDLAALCAAEGETPGYAAPLFRWS